MTRRATKADRRWWRVWCAVWRDIGDDVARCSSDRPRPMRRSRALVATLSLAAACMPTASAAR